MNDLYTEASVKKKVTVGDTLIKVAIVAVIASILSAFVFYQRKSE